MVIRSSHLLLVGPMMRGDIQPGLSCASELVIGMQEPFVWTKQWYAGAVRPSSRIQRSLSGATV